MTGILNLAYDSPQIFRQLLYDLEWSHSLEEAKNGTGWRNPGESIGEARDRLREQRERAKRELEKRKKG